jgi:lysophospholipase L1-like esterase
MGIGDVLRSRRWVLTASLAMNGLLVAALFRHRARELFRRFTAPPSAPSGFDWQKRPAVEKFRENRTQPGSTVFLGDSITSEAQWGELFGGLLNRGVPGNTSRDLLARLDEVTARRPARLFLMIGVNDLFQGAPPDEVVDSVGVLLDRLRAETPETHLTLISMLPIRKGAVRGVENQLIEEVNKRLGQAARARNVRFADAFPKFLDGNGELRAELTYDGVHLRPAGYWLLRDTLGEP